MHFFCTKAKNTTFPFASRHPLRRFKSKMTFYRVHICVSESKAKKAEKKTFVALKGEVSWQQEYFTNLGLSKQNQ